MTKTQLIAKLVAELETEKAKNEILKKELRYYIKMHEESNNWFFDKHIPRLD